MNQDARRFFQYVESHPKGTTGADFDEETNTLVIQVPNRQVARLLQRGLAADRADRARRARRKAQRASRRRNRRS